MRKLRFKVWDREKHRMSKPLSIFSPIVEWEDGDIEMPTNFGLANTDRFVFLQFTGLYEKGCAAEIYEGDVLECSGYTFLVSMNRENHGNILAWNLIDLEDGYAAEYYYGWSPDEGGKLVGNIYQNPEYLFK